MPCPRRRRPGAARRRSRCTTRWSSTTWGSSPSPRCTCSARCCRCCAPRWTATCALWVERLSGAAIASFLAGPDTPDIDTLLRLLRKASRLGESDALLAAWERSPLFHHPAPAASGEDAGAGHDATVHFMPTLDEVVDALTFSTGLALLSTMRMAQLMGDAGTEQSARFRFGVMAGIGR